MTDWDDAFDNSGYVPDAKAIAAQWPRDAAAFRATLTANGLAETDVSYGADPREVLDIFRPAKRSKGILIFVHGGYWHLFSKDEWSHLSNGAVANGWTVVVPSYPLAPEALIPDITRSIRKAVTWTSEHLTGDMVLAGHSAGGHLVTRMICEGVLPKTIVERVTRVVAISGVHILSPLLETKKNEILGLTVESAAAESPINHVPVDSIPVTFWVGADERPEFLRQNQAMSDHWQAAKAEVTTVVETDRHHFDVIASLADPEGALTREVLR